MPYRRPDSELLGVDAPVDTGRESDHGIVAKFVDLYYRRPTSTQRGNPNPATWI